MIDQHHDRNTTTRVATARRTVLGFAAAMVAVLAFASSAAAQARKSYTFLDMAWGTGVSAVSAAGGKAALGWATRKSK